MKSLLNIRQASWAVGCIRFCTGAALALCYVSVAAQPLLYYHADSTRKICQVTGDLDQPLNVPTQSLTGVHSELYFTDLGSTLEHQGQLLFLFGDTWGGREGLLDTMGFSSSTDPFNLTMQVPTSSDGIWQPIAPPGLNLAEFCVPSHGISVNGTIYVVYTQPGTTGDIMKKSYMISSHDNGATWNTLYQLDNHTENQPRFVNVWLEEHNGYIYMFGSGAYRASSPMLARAHKQSFPQKSAWQYYSGTNIHGIHEWSADVAAAVNLFNHNQLGEFSCTWISTLNCWVMLYNSGSPRGITMRTAYQPWGPWSAGTVIMQPDQDQAYGFFMHVNWAAEKRDLFSDPGREEEWGGEYGPYVIPRFTSGTADRCELFYTMSTWNPYQVVLMRSTIGITPPPMPPPTVSQTLGHDLWHRYPNSIAEPFTLNGRPFLSTYTSANGDANTGWLWQRLPAGTKEINFQLRGGHGEIILLETAADLPPSGSVPSVINGIRSGAYGRVVMRATGVESNDNVIPWKWELGHLDTSSLVLVLLDDATDQWGFISVSDIEAKVAATNSTVADWSVY